MLHPRLFGNTNAITALIAPIQKIITTIGSHAGGTIEELCEGDSMGTLILLLCVALIATHVLAYKLGWMMRHLMPSRGHLG